MQRVLSRFAPLAVAALFVGVASAEEELLYFMLDDPLTFNDGTTLSAGDGYDYLMVALSSDGENPAGSYLNLSAGGTAQGTAMYIDGSEPVSGYAASGSYSTADKILFELWFDSPEGSFERVAYHSANLSELRTYIGSSTNPSATPYVVRSVVPEPTSGLLIVLGLAGLALRRKKI